MLRQTPKGLIQDNRICYLIPHIVQSGFVHTKSKDGVMYFSQIVQSVCHGLVTYTICISGSRYPVGVIEQKQAISCSLFGPWLDLRNGALQQELALCTSHVTNKGALVSVNFILQQYDKMLNEFKEKEIKLQMRK